MKLMRQNILCKRRRAVKRAIIDGETGWVLNSTTPRVWDEVHLYGRYNDLISKNCSKSS